MIYNQLILFSDSDFLGMYAKLFCGLVIFDALSAHTNLI